MNERELFIEYMINENPSNSVEFMDDFGWFFDPITELRWLAWQASANRQGYKLVPVEPTEDMLKNVETAKECIFEVSTDYCNIGIPAWVCSDIYKSMIDAVGN